jgi:hypothetical protein
MATFTINDKSAVTSVDPSADFFPIWQGGAQHKATAAQIITAAGISAPLVNVRVTVKTSGGDFTNIASAIDYVETHYSNAKPGNGDVDTSFALVSIDPGVWTVPTSLTGGRNTYLQLSGSTVIYPRMTSIVSSSGSAGNWSIVCQVDTVAGIAVNDYGCFYTPPSGGVNPSYIAGCWKITNVDAVNTRITVNTTHPAATAPSGAVTSYIAIPKTQLHFTQDGIRAWDACCCKISDMVLVGGGGYTGLSAQDESRVYAARLGVVNFETGVYALYGTEINGDAWICANGNTTGFLANHAASIVVSGGLFASANTTGVYCANNSHIGMVAGAISGNTTGVTATLMGQVDCGMSTISANTQGALSTAAGYIQDSSVTYANNGTNINYNISIDGTLRAKASDFVGNVSVSGALSVDTFSGIAAYITGSFSTFYTTDAKCAIYATSGGGSSYPFNVFGHLMLQSRGNAARDVCIATANGVVANFTTSGTVGIGVASGVPSATLDVNGTINGKLLSQASDNVPVGTTSLHALTTGTGNCCLGTASGYSITQGSYNTGLGDSALDNITTGSLNIGIGASAGELTQASASNRTSANSLYIGSQTRALSDGGSNEIVIGHQAVGHGSNTTTIGNTSTTNTYINGEIDSISGGNGQIIAIKSLTELTTIAASAYTDTTIQLPSAATILAVSVRVTAAITCTSTFTVGDSGNASRYSTGAVSKAAGSTNTGNKAGAYYNDNTLSVRITPDTTPTDNTGRVRVTIHYIQITPPTS